MIKGRTNILEYFKSINDVNDNEYIYFNITRRGDKSGNACLSTPKNERDSNWNYDAALQMLTRWLDLQQYGTFEIVLSANEKRVGRGNLKQEFSIDENTGMAGISGFQQPGMSSEDVQTKITSAVTEALEKYKREQEHEAMKKELAEIKKENKELEKRANDPWNKLIAGIGPYVPDLLVEQGLIPKKNVAGVPNSTADPVAETEKEHPANENDELQRQERLQNALNKISAARPNDGLELLELVAGALEKNPSLGDKVKMFLTW